MRIKIIQFKETYNLQEIQFSLKSTINEIPIGGNP